MQNRFGNLIGNLRCNERVGSLREGAVRKGVFSSAAGRLAALRVLVGPLSSLRKHVRLAVAVAAAAFMLLAVNVSGFVQGSDASLVIMGFDPDRAQLITSLLVGAGAAALAYLCSDLFVTAVLLGLFAATILYADTFAQETTSALASTGADGIFDPGGWLLTLVTLVTTAVVVGWSAATLSGPIRRHLIAAGQVLVGAVRERRIDLRALAGPIVVAVIATLLAVSVPTLGDMLNYTPDSHMLTGGQPLEGLAGGDGSTPSATAGPGDMNGMGTPSPSPSQTPTSGPDLTPSASASVAANSGPRPWLAWRPSGPGRVETDGLPAPWVGGHTLDISVYLPPGYQTSGQRRYPVEYEPLDSFARWNQAFGVKAELDVLTDQGTIPASLVVFIDTSGGPYQDSECANSTDGEEWMGRFLGETVPTYIDAHYRTITEPAARTLLGFSQGGYCAAMLILDYPNVFGNAVSISGYFHAGLGSANAWRPFGHDQSVLDQYSPALVAPQLSASTISSLYFVIDFDPAQPLYGPEGKAFVAVLQRSGYAYAVIDSPQHHSWTQVRYGLSPTLALVASRQAGEAVFS